MKTVREWASKILFGFAELGSGHFEAFSSVDERSEEFIERSLFEHRGKLFLVAASELDDNTDLLYPYY